MPGRYLRAGRSPKTGVEPETMERPDTRVKRVQTGTLKDLNTDRRVDEADDGSSDADGTLGRVIDFRHGYGVVLI